MFLQSPTPNLPPSQIKEFLLLNTTYEPLRVCSWRKAILLLIKQKAILIANNVIKLINYVRIPFQAAAHKPSKVAIFKRDHHTCQYCGTKKNLTLDHVLPRSKGGLNTWENLVTACESCNLKKGNRLLSELGEAMILLNQPQEPLSRLYTNSISLGDWMN